jgi:hypothetical protein
MIVSARSTSFGNRSAGIGRFWIATKCLAQFVLSVRQKFCFSVAAVFGILASWSAKKGHLRSRTHSAISRLLFNLDRHLRLRSSVEPREEPRNPVPQAQRDCVALAARALCARIADDGRYTSHVVGANCRSTMTTVPSLDWARRWVSDRAPLKNVTGSETVNWDPPPNCSTHSSRVPKKLCV